MTFEELASQIKADLLAEWDENRGDYRGILTLQKRAIIGYEKEVGFFLQKIGSLITKYHAEATEHPSWYPSLPLGIYHENWGLAGAAEWFAETYRSSSSCKIIGDRIYFLDKGKMRLMPQKISKERREQLIRAFLLLTPEERMDKDCHEVYLLDGTRITIFRGAMVKEGQDAIVFRRYIVPRYTFEEQASRHTIPEEAIPFLKTMAQSGFNVAFTGPLRSAKTTFLSTWQSYEDPSLEGVMVETDPEIPLHLLMPDAPLLQILADGERLETVSKNLLRSDADYIILAEARDGNALDLAVRMAGKGTRRMKMTFHLRNPEDFARDVAWEIVKVRGGDLETTMGKVASGFDYIFHFVQLKAKDRKRLRGIYQLSYDRKTGEIAMEPICRYDFKKDSWTFRYVFSEEKRRIAEEENPGSEVQIETMLRELSERFPMKGYVSDEGKEGKTDG